MQIHKTGKHKHPHEPEGKEEAINRPEHQQFLRKAASEGIVLLKNTRKLLPLDLSHTTSVAFIGPNAAESVAAGGGSASLNPHYRQTPFDSFRTNAAAAFPGVRVTHARGCLAHKWIPLFPVTCVSPVNGVPGLHMEYFGNMELEGAPVHAAHRTSTVLSCYDNLPPSFTPGMRYSYRATGLLTPRSSGRHVFSMGSCGPGRLLVDGEALISIWDRTKDSVRSEMFMAYASPEVRRELDMVAGRTYTVVVEGVSRELDAIPVHYTDELYRDEVMDGSRVGFMEEVKDDLLGEAVAAARAADVAVLVVGKNIEWESEAYDMKTMDLPGEQDALIAAVLAANPNTVVVNQSGSPITMPWLDDAHTLVQAWYQGQELGNSLWDVLTGAVSPCGKLPVTFPRRLQDTPCFHNFPGENDTVMYGEGIYLGYRHYDAAGLAPAFAFGHGLSYTTFTYANTRLSLSSSSASSTSPFPSSSSTTSTTEPVFRGKNDTLTVSVDVTNTGAVRGKEAVQFYVAQTSKPGLPRPPKELKGFAKVDLAPGETRPASAVLDRHALAYFDDRRMCWVVDRDAEYVVYAAASSVDLRGEARFRVDGALEWVN